jgi:hypothetical protein
MYIKNHYDCYEKINKIKDPGFLRARALKSASTFPTKTTLGHWGLFSNSCVQTYNTGITIAIEATI